MSLSDRFVEMHSIPVNDNRGEQIQPSHAVMLPFAGAVANFALAADAKGVHERMMSLSLVEAGAGTALHIGVKQPVQDEQRSCHPSDFAKIDGQFVLARFLLSGSHLSSAVLRQRAWGYSVWAGKISCWWPILTKVFM